MERFSFEKKKKEIESANIGSFCHKSIIFTLKNILFSLFFFYIILQFLSCDLHGVLFSCLKNFRNKRKEKVAYNPPPLVNVHIVTFLNLCINKISYLDLGVLEDMERGFSQHTKASATHVNTKITMIMERDIIDDHNNLVEILIGLHWCSTISVTLFFTMVQFDSLCKSGYMSNKSWMDLL